MVVRSWYRNKMPTLWLILDIHQRIFSALMEADNFSQESACPHFCNSIRNISTKTHKLYKKVAIHMLKSLHSWYKNLVMPFIDMISLIQFTTHIVSRFNFFLVFLICIYSHLSSDISFNHIILYIFLFILCTIPWVYSACMFYTHQYRTSRSNIFIKHYT